MSEEVPKLALNEEKVSRFESEDHLLADLDPSLDEAKALLKDLQDLDSTILVNEEVSPPARRVIKKPPTEYEVRLRKILMEKVDEKRLTCPKCQKKCNNITVANKHRALCGVIKLPRKKISCKKCKSSCMEGTNFVAHHCIDSAATTVKCPKCLKEFLPMGLRAHKCAGKAQLAQVPVK